ncbi:response regulator [Maridesulfovibrio zosterae]|uniref:response regulator n=1 Tax=Maridesulfovibrio zosterae TaxID=82171 RepID=UPI0003F9B311|nr:response regulator [Maridesulfovibrio zosterae]
MKILLVDDERINSLSASKLLEKDGHEVVSAANGAQALERLHESHFDCILMDIQMPVMDGYEAVARIRDTSVFGKKSLTPIIAMTGHTYEDSKENLKKAGLKFYVAKPFDITELLEVIKEATEDHLQS